mmetsp:Transcript_12664/g.29399  ORF Transcript_12664/g.29399 Transcript_12664/m.29399 type:complete len:382 (+) Transcript_12664:52-1197(+)
MADRTLFFFFIALCVLGAVSGFISSQRPATTAKGWGRTPSVLFGNKYKKKDAKPPGVIDLGPPELVHDWEGVDLIRCFGANKVRKMQRKFKRIQNAKARAAVERAVKERNRRLHWTRTEANKEKRAIKNARRLARTGDPLKLIISGAPASGKGTQCEQIKEKFGVVHLSTGDMLRSAVAAGTEVGKKAKSFMDSGKLVPDDVIIGVVTDRLAEEDCQSQGWLLDGFPRTQAQAKALEDAGVEADGFLFLKVPDDVLVERVVGRRSDPETGKIYHMTFSPPPDNEKVKARLVQRSDDTEEKVKVRLEQFHTNVGAVIGDYQDICVDIDGNQPLEHVTMEIREAIEVTIAKKLEAQLEAHRQELAAELDASQGDGGFAEYAAE